MSGTDRVGDVVLEVAPLGALVATIDRPEARNALAPSVLEGLLAAIDRVERDGHPVLVVRGSGGALSAGADLTHLLSLVDDHDAVGRYVADIGEVNLRVESCPAVSIAVIDGFALAGGCELLLSCDLGVVTARARIGDRHLEYGLLPGAGGSVRLPQSLPGPLARRLMLTGEMVDGETAYAWGLASHLVAEPDRLDAELDQLLARLGRHSPTALRGMKRMYRDGAALPHRAALGHELDLFLEHLTTPTVDEGLRAFRDGRAPSFPDLWKPPVPAG
ncbi:MAG: enoyl-CoA hydratase/isomerase family protein [Actinomycetota bacterium]|nr:enoyl-CoA hydratase/isomerase family protein [Actinomycetota bacterium]